MVELGKALMLVARGNRLLDGDKINCFLVIIVHNLHNMIRDT